MPRNQVAIKDQLLNPNFLKSLSEILPTTFSPERMVRLALSSIAGNDRLMQCNVNSIRFGIVEAARLGLEIGGPLGQAYLTPRKGQAVLVLGYRGMIDIAIRTGLVNAIMAEVVRDGDKFSFEYGTQRKLRHVPVGDPDAPVTHAYALADMPGGTQIFHVLSRKEIERVRLRSEGGRSEKSPWATDYAEMARKTALRSIFKLLPTTPAVREIFARQDAQGSDTDAIRVDAASDRVIDGEIVDPQTGELLIPDEARVV
jgi:recombination protein RecT